MSFAAKIARWQLLYGRHDLPWQNTRNPYKIWLSEIMLQQTQVITVKDYFKKFLARFPNIHLLAQASQDEVLALWAGLGYYSRARNLHNCAQTIIQTWGARFPRTPHELATLKGVGNSTAAAIAVFAYGYPAPILDGNVKRILCRYFGIDTPAGAATDKMLWAIAKRELLNEQDAAQLKLSHADGLRAYTQGLMDLGATRCTRHQPKCEICPLTKSCYAYQHQKTTQLPQAKLPVSVREINMRFVIYRHQGQLWLEKRPNSGIWAGLYAFPQEPRLSSMDVGTELPNITHRLTHRLLQLSAHVIDVSTTEACTLNQTERRNMWLSKNNLETIGMPKPIASWAHELLRIER